MTTSHLKTQNLIIALGSNLGDHQKNFNLAISQLKKNFIFVEKSRIYRSKAVDFTDQPDFYNMVIHLQNHKNYSPTQILNYLQLIEQQMGRQKIIPKGPRIIDLDLIFIDFISVHTEQLQVPHPRWRERSFVVKPLQELKIWSLWKNHFQLDENFIFQTDAHPLT